jgi:hypothetical protein
MPHGRSCANPIRRDQLARILGGSPARGCARDRTRQSREISGLAGLAGGVARVARGLLLFLGERLALLAGGALLGLDRFLGFLVGSHARGFLVRLLTALLSLGQLVLLAQGFLFGGALGGQLVEFGVGGGGLGLEAWRAGPSWPPAGWSGDR